ncbi:DUF1015 domain-containing protein [bacterium]|nr:DUF1015 domain-containing protein [bacterium]
MIELKPFRGYRYSLSGSDLGSVLAPPYDVISPDEQKALYDRNSHNIVRLDFGYQYDADTPTDNRYTRARASMTEWIQSGVLVRDDTPAFYLYEHHYQADGQWKNLRGILGACKLFRFEEGHVLPHENTMPGPIQDRLELTKATQANLSPIYTLFDDPNLQFSRITEPVWERNPSQEAQMQSGERYRVWVVTETDMVRALYDFFTTRKLLIADGHHRYTTALHYRDWCRENGAKGDDIASDYTMVFAAAMNGDGITIYPTHRVVFGLPVFIPDRFREALSQYFKITEYSSHDAFKAAIASAAPNKTIGLMFSKESSVLGLDLRPDAPLADVFPAGASDVLKGLDVSILQYIIFQKILGFSLENIRQQKDLKYIKSDQGVLEAVAKGDVQAAFLLQATRLDEMRDVCLNGEKMPQKSTYFYPKLITGLVVNPVDPQEMGAQI